MSGRSFLGAFRPLARRARLPRPDTDLLVEALEPRILLSGDLSALTLRVSHKPETSVVVLTTTAPPVEVITAVGTGATPLDGVLNSSAATAETWIGGASGRWDTPGNWSGGAVPDATADVTIAGDTVVSLGSDAAHSIALSGGVTLQGGSLALGASSSLAGSSLSGTTLTLGGGLTLSGTDAITNSNLDATAGIVANAGTLLLQGSNDQTIAGALTNTGTIALTGTGSLLLATDGADVADVNRAGGVVDLQGTGGIGNRIGDGLSLAVDNAGTIEKTTDAGTAPIRLADLTNQGAIAVDAGTLALGSGTLTSLSGSTLTVAAGAIADLTGGGQQAYGGTLTATGAGTVALTGGELDIVPSGLTLDAAPGVFAWTGGAIQATATTLTNVGTINLSGTAEQYFAGMLDNVGTIDQDSAGFDLYYPTYSTNYAGTLDNGGLYQIQNDSSVGGSGPIVNTGTFEKSAGSGTSVIDLAFDNDAGTVDVASGTLNLTSGTETAGTFQSALGATLLLTGPYLNDFVFSGTLTGTGQGSVEFVNVFFATAASGATFDFAPGELHLVDGLIDASSGTFTNAGSMALSNSTSDRDEVEADGTLDNTGTMTLDGALTLDGEYGAATLENAHGGSIGLFGTSTIRGSGVLANDGAITVSSGNSTLSASTVNLDADGAVAVDGGTLNLSGNGTYIGQSFAIAAGASLDLSGGTYVGTESSTGAGTIDFSGGTIGTGGATFDFAPGIFSWTTGTVDARLGTLTNAGSLVLSGTDSKIVGGTFANTGSITQSGGSLQLEFETYTAYIGGTLDNSGTYTILDDGGIADGAIANTGTIRKTGGTTTSTIGSDLSGSGTLSLQSGSVTLAGTLRLDGATLADLSGTLTLGYGSIANTTFQTTTLAQDTQTEIEFSQAVTLSGNEVGIGTGLVVMAGGHDYTAGPTGATLDFGGSGLVFQGGLLDGGTAGFTNDGLLTVSQVSQQSQQAGVLNNDGTLAIAGVSIFEMTGTSLVTNEKSGVIDFQGDGEIYSVGGSGVLSLVNEGIIRKSEGTMSEIESSGYDGAGGSLDGAAGTLLIGNTTNQGTTVLVAGTLSGAGDIALSGNLSVAAAGATFDFAPGVADWTGGNITGGTLTNAGTLTLTGTDRHEFGGIVDNTGTIVQEGGYLGLDGAQGTVLNNSGLYDLQGDGLITNKYAIGALFDNTGTLTRSAGAGTGTVIPDNLVSTGIVSVSAGTLDANDGEIQRGTLTGGTWAASKGATLDLGTIDTNDATITLDGAGSTITSLSQLSSNQGTLSVADGATLATTGDFANSGTLGIGSSSTVSIGGNYSQSASGTLATTIDGSPAAKAFGTLAVTGSASLGGTYQATLATGFGAAAGDVYRPVSYASAAGTFTSIVVPPTLQATVEAKDVAVGVVLTGADLAVTGVNIATPATAPGQSVTVQFTVTNEGGAAATGNWTDSVYLSLGDTLQPDDILLGRLDHIGNVAAGGSYTATLTAALPPVADGPYRILVLADSRDMVSDGDRANNLGASAGALAITTPLLTLGGTVSGRISAGEDAYYRIAAAPGDDVSLQAALASAGDAQIYLGVGRLPTISAFDQTDATAGAAQSFTLTAIASGDVYVLVHGLAGTAQAFTLDASKAPLSITGLISPDGVNDSSDTVVGVTGTRFSSTTTLSLVASDGTAYAASGVTYVSPVAIAGTFDLTSIPAGTYTVVAKDNGAAASAATPYTVVPLVYSTDVTQLNVSIQSPGDVIAGGGGAVVPEPVPVAVTFQNPTDTPILVSNFDLSVVNGTFPKIPFLYFTTNYDNGAAEEEVAALISPSDPELVPAHSTIAVRTTAAPNPDQPNVLVSFGGQFADVTNGPLDLASLSATLKPATVSQDAWNAIFQNLSAAIGPTTQSLSTLEQNDDVLLQLASGSSTPPTATDALELEVLKAADALPTPVLDAATDIAYPEPGLPLSFARSFQSTISGRYTDGRLGQGWIDSWEYGATSDSADNLVDIQQGAAFRQFTINADGTFTASTGDTGVLTESDGAYRLTEQTGAVTQFNADGTLDYVQDPSGNRITAGYGGGEMTSLADADGDRLTIAYNADGKIASVTDPSGRVATYGYDSTGRDLTSVTTVSGTVTYGYAAATTGPTAYELTSISDPGGTQILFGYDSQGRLSQETGAGGADAVTYAYGTNDYTVTGAVGSTTTYYFDQTAETFASLDPLGHFVSASFNDIGKVTSLSEVGGGASTVGYASTPTGTTAAVTDPTGGLTTLSYAPGNAALTGITDQDGNATSYGHDPNGNVTSITYADGTRTSFAYAADGSVMQSVQRDGATSSYVHDARGLLLSQTLSDGTTTSYAYDAHGNMLTATAASGTITMSYDGADRLTKVTYPDGRFLAYSYDAGGRRTQSVDQDGFATNYSYDALGRLSEMTDGSGNLIAKYTYDAAGDVIRQDNGNRTYTTTAYDDDGNVSSIVNYAPDGAINSRFDYTYDVLGRVATMTTLAGTATYSYDADSRLTGARLPDGTTITYQYDAASNRKAVVANGVSTTYTVNDLNQYITVGGDVQSYDANGDLTNDGGGATYSYNASGRLTAVTSASGTWTYGYDALGNLTDETHDGVETTFLVDPTGLGNIVAQYGANGQLVADYTYGNGLTSQVSSSGGASYYDFDALGSTAGLTGAAGSYVVNYTYDPFGNVISSSGSATSPFQFEGRFGVQSDGSGLENMGARSYDPVAGRFLQPDPIGIDGGTNLYNFVKDDVTGNVDPIGTTPVAVAARIFEGAFSTYNTYGYASGILSPDGNEDAVQNYIDLGVNAGLDLFVSSGFAERLALGDVPVAIGGVENLAALFGVTADLGLTAEVTASLVSLPVSALSIVIGAEISYVIKGLRDIYAISQIDSKPPSTSSAGASNTLLIAGPHDPNFISGPAGYGTGQYILGDANGAYDIAFTNEPTAGAPARTVTVTEQLDPNLDLSTFQLGSFGFGDNSFAVPDGLQDYSARIDDRSETGVFVDFSAHLDVQTRSLTVTYTSIDPTTLDDEANPIIGFLPPDKIPAMGTGWLTYTVSPKADLVTGETITSKASVVFDTEAPVVTAAYVNTIDNTAPSSAVLSLPAISSAAVALAWSGSDGNGSGITSYDLFVSEDGGSYKPVLVDTSSTSTIFQGSFGHSYSFYTTATDNVGHVEAPPDQPDATTSIDAAPVASNISGAVSNQGPAITIAASYTDPDQGDTHGFTIDTAGTKGTVIDNRNGTFTYSPNDAFAGLAAGQHATDSFAYTVTDAAGLFSTATATITIIGQDTGPVASDITGSVSNDGPAITLVASYTDPDQASTRVTIDTTGTKGVVTNNDGAFTYNPDGAFAGLTLGQHATDSFTYTVTDAAGLSSTATATITVVGQDTAPVASNITGTVSNHGPAITLAASYTDPDQGDAHSFTIDATATKGTVINNGNGTFTYNPNGAFAGLAAGQDATDSFAYTVTDSAGLSSTATATITVVGQSATQLAAYPDGPYDINSGRTLTVGVLSGVLANDGASGSGTLTAVLVDGPSHGTLGLAANGSFTYTPNAGYVGSDQFSYRATNGVLTSPPVPVTITVTPATVDTLTVRIGSDGYRGVARLDVGIQSDPGGGAATFDISLFSGTGQEISLTGSVVADPTVLAIDVVNDLLPGLPPSATRVTDVPAGVEPFMADLLNGDWNLQVQTDLQAADFAIGTSFGSTNPFHNGLADQATQQLDELARTVMVML